MARAEDHAVRLAEAKARVLRAAERLTPAQVVREHPLEAVSAAFLAGVSAGSGPGGASRRVLGEMASFFLKHLL